MKVWIKNLEAQLTINLDEVKEEEVRDALDAKKDAK